MPFGRGGVGNLQAIEHENAKVSADLEANQSAAESDHKGGVPADYLDKEEQQYAHTGRGGAGNYYSPKELSKTGRFDDAHRSHILGDGTQPPAGSPAAASGSEPPSYNAAPSAANSSSKGWGRGGAGNISYGMFEDEERAARKRIRDNEAREKLKAEVEKGVKESLAMPQKAKLPGEEPY